MNRIYIANLGKYNERELLGGWLNLPFTQDEQEELFVKIKLAHYNECGEYIENYVENGVIYEEYAIHDYETDFEELVKISENADIFELSEIFEEIECFDESEIELINAIIEVTGYELSEAISNKDGAVYYSGYDLESLAEEFIDEGLYGDIPDALVNYIDYAAIARDLRYDYSETRNGVIRMD